MARSSMDPIALEAEIASLGDLSPITLRERWQALYGTPAPRSLRRDMLIRAVAYELQGLSPVPG